MIAASSGMIGMMFSVSGCGPSMPSLGFPGMGVPFGWGVAASSGAGEPAGDERGVFSMSSFRWLRRSRWEGLLGVAGTAAGVALVFGLAFAGAAVTADGMLSPAYFRTWSWASDMGSLGMPS